VWFQDRGGRYAVVKCPKCGELQLAHLEVERRKCAYCFHYFKLRPKWHWWRRAEDGKAIYYKTKKPKNPILEVYPSIKGARKRLLILKRYYAQMRAKNLS